MSPPFSGLKNKPSKKPAFHAFMIFLGLFFGPEGRGDMSLPTVS
jgi:hypothetical protein